MRWGSHRSIGVSSIQSVACFLRSLSVVSSVIRREWALAAPWGKCPAHLNPEILARSESVGSIPMLIHVDNQRYRTIRCR
jgi:hypothetical protein